MADEKVYLKIGENVLPVEPEKGYTLSLQDSDSINQTEGGTTARDIVRMNIPSISVSFDCDKEMLLEMRSHKAEPSLDVEYFDPVESNELQKDSMYVTNYSEKMLADTEDGGIWRVTFNLEDLGNV